MGITNVGVAAHIRAASPGGARYDPDMTSEERSSFSNGIWLCQTHAKLVDDDEVTFSTPLLLEWKEVAEHMAALETRGYEVRSAMPFAGLERKAPMVLAEMRADFGKQPLVREMIVLANREIGYWHGETPCFAYYLEDHDQLMSVLTIMEHVGAIYDIRFNNVPRYNFTEEFVTYLLGE
jgi:hypothetical protein